MLKTAGACHSRSKKETPESPMTMGRETSLECPYCLSAIREDRRAAGSGGIRTRSARQAPSPLGRSLAQRQADAQAMQAQLQKEGLSDDETEDIAPPSLPASSRAGNAAPLPGRARDRSVHSRCMLETGNNDEFSLYANR